MHIVGNHETKSFLMDGVGKKNQVDRNAISTVLCSASVWLYKLNWLQLMR